MRSSTISSAVKAGASSSSVQRAAWCPTPARAVAGLYPTPAVQRAHRRRLTASFHCALFPSPSSSSRHSYGRCCSARTCAVPGQSSPQFALPLLPQSAQPAMTRILRSLSLLVSIHTNLQVGHAAGSGGLSALCLYGPVVGADLCRGVAAGCAGCGRAQASKRSVSVVLPISLLQCRAALLLCCLWKDLLPHRLQRVWVFVCCFPNDWVPVHGSI